MSGINVQIDISTEDERWKTLCNDDALEDIISSAAVIALEKKNLSPSEIEVSVVLTDDAQIQTLNREYRDKDKPTNVLSFPQTDFTDSIDAAAPFLCLGDLVMAYGTLEREAKEQSKSLLEHFTHLCVHGTLHLLGYDHIDASEATEMEALEVEILAGMGIKNPYQGI